MRLLFVAEKNSEMQAVRQTYEMHKKDVEEKLGVIDFVALSGHVTRYKDPKEYPEWSLPWTQLTLPMLPKEFVLTEPTGDYSKKILRNFESVIERTHYDALICGTDPDVEGNGIFYNLARYKHLTNIKTYRFFAASLTDGEILKSLLNMTDFYRNPREIRMTETYLARSHFDWEVGMNASVGVSLKKAKNKGEVMRVGRVKAPTIKLVYDNSKAIDSFVPHSDYLAKITYLNGFTGVLLSDDGKERTFEKKEDAEAYLNEITDSFATVKSIERKRTKKYAPVLYRLSTIQTEAGNIYNYTPEETLSIIQGLYEKRLVSYPRTDCSYVTREMAEKFGSLLKSAFRIPELKEYIRTLDQEKVDAVKDNERVVNDDEVAKSSHDALLPTENAPDYEKLSIDEKNIYGLICKRLLAQFLPPITENKTVLFTEFGGEIFKSNGSTVIEKGWSVLYERQNRSEEIPDELDKDSQLVVFERNAYEKKSEPPKRLTTATLVQAMENISKYIDDKELKNVMKLARGIGTPATRAEIIKEIVKTGYVECKGKNNALYISDFGERYIESLNGFSIIDPTAAATWEAMFQDVKEGHITYKEAKKKTENYVYKFMSEIADMAQEVKENAVENMLINAKCPYCKGQVVRTGFGYQCEGNRQKLCKFVIFDKQNLITEDDITELIETGKTRKIQNIVYSKKNDRFYTARLKLCTKENSNVVEFIF